MREVSSASSRPIRRGEGAAKAKGAAKSVGAKSPVTRAAKPGNGARKPSKPAGIPKKPARQASAAPNPGAAKPRPPKAATPDGAKKPPVKPGEDMFLEEWDVPSPAEKRRRRRENLTALNLLLLSGIVAVLALGGVVLSQRAKFVEMKNYVEAQTFYDGTTVDGVDVSGMTLGDAMDYWRTRIEPAYSERTVALDGGDRVTARELGYASDFESVLSSAWGAGRRGSLEERYFAAKNRQLYPAAYAVRRTLYSEPIVDAYVRLYADKIDKPAKDAAIAGFDMEKYAFVFSESETGRKLNASVLKSSIIEALSAGGGSAKVEIETLEPEISVAEAASRYGMITSAVTNASSSSSNRLSNIATAMGIINGTCLKPGEVFSFNDTVGERTTARGFKVATAYSGGTVTEEVGGGICQVSTTLFNAAVKADLEIVERHNHSLTVSYVDKGKDAAVNWGDKDLRFKNTTGDDLYICCLLGSDKRIRFGIFGRLLENGETITVEGVTTGTIRYETEYQPTAFLAPGETKVIEQGKDGYTAEAYKLRWDASGNLISRELLCKSSYKARKEIIQYGA